jgi:hypothetical protein
MFSGAISPFFLIFSHLAREKTAVFIRFHHPSRHVHPSRNQLKFNKLALAAAALGADFSRPVQAPEKN